MIGKPSYAHPYFIQRTTIYKYIIQSTMYHRESIRELNLADAHYFGKIYVLGWNICPIQAGAFSLTRVALREIRTKTNIVTR